MIPRQLAFGGGDPFHVPLHIATQPAIAPIPFPDTTVVETQIAHDAFRVSGRMSWEPPFSANPVMNSERDFTGLLRPATNALQAQREFRRNKR